MLRKKTIVFQSKILLVVLVIIASFLAAFIGQLIIASIGSQAGLAPQNFIIRSSTNQDASRREAALTILEREASGFVEIYSLVSGILQKTGEGVVLTNDGWIVAVSSEKPVSTHVRLSSGRLLSIERNVPDPATGLSYFEIDSEILTPVTLASAFAAEPLDQLLIADYRGTVEPATYLGERLKDQLYLSADEKNRFPAVRYPLSGARVYNGKAELTGMVIENGVGSGIDRIVPVEHLRSSFDGLLREGNIVYPVLGLQYIDLAHSAVEGQLRSLPTSGAWITNAVNDPSRGSMNLRGPLFQAGLRLDDVIVSVDSTVLNHKATLSDLLLSRKPGDSVELGLVRQGVPISIEVVLPQEQNG